MKPEDSLPHAQLEAMQSHRFPLSGNSNLAALCVTIIAIVAMAPAAFAGKAAATPKPESQLMNEPTSGTIVAAINVIAEGNSIPPPLPLPPSKESEEEYHRQYEEWAKIVQPGCPVILTLWDTGRIIWSEDRIHGGPPYREAWVDPEQIARRLGDLAAEYAAAQSIHGQTRAVWDAPSTMIILRSGDQFILMDSCHELRESWKRGTIMSANLTMLPRAGKSLDEVLKDDPPEYRAFRRVWDEIKNGLFGLTPKDGGIIKPELRFNRWPEVPRPVAGE